MLATSPRLRLSLARSDGGQAGGEMLDKVKDHSARLPTLPGWLFFAMRRGRHSQTPFGNEKYHLLSRG